MVDVVRDQSWFSRIGGAIKGVIFGCILFLIAIPVLFLNEGRAVRTAKGLAEGASAVVETNSEHVDPSNEGKFVHLTGKATTEDSLSDDLFGITFDGIRLERHVEMYQWVENKSTKKKKKLGGGTRRVTTYSYDQKWKNSLVNSKNFHQPEEHQNPSNMPYKQFVAQASEVSLGAFKLSNSLVDQISKPSSIKFELEQLPESIGTIATITKDAPDGGCRLYIAGENAPAAQSATVGDVRIWFTGTSETDVSVMSKQVGNSFEPFQTNAGPKLNMLKSEIVSAALMIEEAEADNITLTWILRILGIAMMCGGLAIAFRPLAVIGDVVPFIGSIVGFGTTLISIIAGTGFAFCIISVAWLFYRPLIGVPLLVVGIGLLIWVTRVMLKQPKQLPGKTAEELPYAQVID